LPLILLPLLLITLLAFCSSFFSANNAYGHTTKTFGNITLEVGWSNEPALVGQLNNVIVQVNQTSSGKNNAQTPVINALADMSISVKYGGATKPVDFLPSEETEGLYNGQIIPTRSGTYSLVLDGNIQNQKINAEIPLDLVESTQKFNFPDCEGSVGGGIGTTSGCLLFQQP
jgi:hypothetical protein